MLEVKQVVRKEDEKAVYTKYEVGCYELIERKYNVGYTHIEVKLKEEYEFTRENFVPRIYYSQNDEGQGKFEIHTISYGAVSPETIQKIVAGYQEALATVELMEKMFLK